MNLLTFRDNQGMALGQRSNIQEREYGFRLDELVARDLSFTSNMSNCRRKAWSHSPLMILQKMQVARDLSITASMSVTVLPDHLEQFSLRCHCSWS